MTSNPFEAPTTDPLHAGGGGGTSFGEPQAWDIAEVFSEAWARFQRGWPVYLGTLVVYLLIMVVLAFVMGALTHMVLGELLGALIDNLVSMVVSAFLTVGMLRIYIAGARDEHNEVGMLFEGGDRFLTMLLVTLLSGLAMGLGFLLLIVPGIIIALGLCFDVYLAADTRRGVVECLGKSWEITTGHKMQLFLFVLVAFGINLVGLIPCGLGLLVTAPLTGLATAIIYTRLTGTTGPAEAA